MTRHAAMQPVDSRAAPCSSRCVDGMVRGGISALPLPIACLACYCEVLSVCSRRGVGLRGGRCLRAPSGCRSCGAHVDPFLRQLSGVL